MAKNIVETLLGAVVLVVAGIFLVFAYGAANVRAIRGYEVTANEASSASHNHNAITSEVVHSWPPSWVCNSDPPSGRWRVALARQLAERPS